MTQFENWMQTNGLSESSAKKYSRAITGVMSKWALDHHISAVPLIEVISPDEFRALIEQITVLPIFRQRDSVGNKMYSSALRKYLQYLVDLPVNTVERDIDFIIGEQSIESSEKVSLIKTRIGQGKFRSKLIAYWKACSVSGYTDTNLLIASHIKPWFASSNQERLDVYNGFLLLPNLDRAFDQGYITFNDVGRIVISRDLKTPAAIGISQMMAVQLEPKHNSYLDYHRENVFKG